MVERFRRYWADTIVHTEKISSGQTFTDILNIHCDLDLECSNPIFSTGHRLMMLYYQNKVGCKPTSSLEDTTEIVIVCLYKPSLWPWHWTQWTNFSPWPWQAWHPVSLFLLGTHIIEIIVGRFAPGLGPLPSTKCSEYKRLHFDVSFHAAIFILCQHC